MALRRSHGVIAPLALAAAVAVAAPLAFLHFPAATTTTAVPRNSLLRGVGPVGPTANAAGSAEPPAEGAGLPALPSWRVLASVAAALLLAASAPQAGFADGLDTTDKPDGGLLGGFGRVNYNDASTFGPNKQATLAQSRAEVLQDAAAKAQDKALKAAREAQERTKAAELFSQLDEQRGSQEKSRQTAALEQEQQREKVLKVMEAQAASQAAKTDAATAQWQPKAQLFFQKFFNQEQEKRIEAEAQDKKKDEARLKVAAALEQRRADAQKAAAEAEEIAKRIEELARNAREAAELAKKLADIAA